MVKKILNKIKNNIMTKKYSNKFCYSNIIWNSKDNLIILLSFTTDYISEAMELQEAISATELNEKLIYYSDNNIDKYYLLIGGAPSFWQNLYMNMHNLGNKLLHIITDEIINNCDEKDFFLLIHDNIMHNFKYNISYDENIIINDISYNDINKIILKLPKSFKIKDILKFININDNGSIHNAYDTIKILKDNMSESEFKSSSIFKFYSIIINNVTIEKLLYYIQPLYKQNYDNSEELIESGIEDKDIDEIFKEYYEKFIGVADDNIYYKDIDEIVKE